MIETYRKTVINTKTKFENRVSMSNYPLHLSRAIFTLSMAAFGRNKVKLQKVTRKEIRCLFTCRNDKDLPTWILIVDYQKVHNAQCFKSVLQLTAVHITLYYTS